MQIDKTQYEKVLSYIEHGKREGATLVTGGKPSGEKGYYIEPTIFSDVMVSPSPSDNCLLVELCEQRVFSVCGLFFH